MMNNITIAAYNSDVPYGNDVVRLHLNESPFALPPAVYRALEGRLEQHLSLYPDSDCEALRTRLADYVGVSPDMVALGNGIDELILLTTLSLSGARGKVVLTNSTFPGYASSARVVGAAVVNVSISKMGLIAQDIIRSFQNKADIAFICNPHNPTGTVLSPEDVDHIIDAAEAAGTIPVFDEAYMEYADDQRSSALRHVRTGRQVLVLRTFSKAWGLASIRVGYAIGAPQTVERIWEFRRTVPFNINRLAQQVIPVALDNDEYLEVARNFIKRSKEDFYSYLDEKQLTYVPSVTNFVMVCVDCDSTYLANRLIEHYGVLVRDLASFGLPGHVRISIGKAGDMQRLCRALDKEIIRTRIR